MGARTLAGLVLTAATVAACGSSVATPPSGPRAAIVTVTRGFGQRTLSAARAAPGQSALMALRRVAHVSTSYGGRFVQAIDGLAGDQSHGMAWLYFVNGIQANVGAADYTLHPGDTEWWDYRYWNDLIQVPVAIGAWPDPFVHGYGGKRPAVSVTGPACAAQAGHGAADAPAPTSSRRSDAVLGAGRDVRRAPRRRSRRACGRGAA